MQIFFHNPFDVRLSAVMSLFKGFSVVGSALAGLFLEHTMPRSAPVAWDVFGGQQAALAPIQMLAWATGFTAVRAVGGGARESRSTSGTEPGTSFGP